MSDESGLTRSLARLQSVVRRRTERMARAGRTVRAEAQAAPSRRTSRPLLGLAITAAGLAVLVGWLLWAH